MRVIPHLCFVGKRYKLLKTRPCDVDTSQIPLHEPTVADRITRSYAIHKSSRLSALRATYNESVSSYRKQVGEIKGTYGKIAYDITRGRNNILKQYDDKYVFHTFERRDDGNAPASSRDLLSQHTAYHSIINSSTHMVMREKLDNNRVRYHIFPNSAKKAFDAREQLLEARNAYYVARYGEQDERAAQPREVIQV